MRYQVSALKFVCLFATLLSACGSHEDAPAPAGEFQVVASPAEKPKTVVGLSPGFEKPQAVAEKTKKQTPKPESAKPLPSPAPQKPAEKQTAAEAVQEEINSLTINKLKFENDDRSLLEAEDFQKYISHSAGGKLSITKLGDDAANLKKQFPEFVSITTRLDPVKGKKGAVDLTFEFLRKRVIRSVQIIIPASEKDAPSDLREKLLTSAGKNVREEDLTKDVETLRQIFIGMGYPKNSVKSEVKLLDKKQGTVSVLFHVKLGSAKAVIGEFSFKGNRSLSDDELTNQMKNSSSSWTSFFTGGSTFDLTKLELDINALSDFYRSKGFPNAYVAYAYEVNSSGKTRVMITVKEGKRFSVKSIKFLGNKVFSDSTLREKLTFQVGSFYNAKALRTSLQQIRELYGSKGYAAAAAEISFDQEKQSLTITILEGTVKYVERVEIKGNTTSQETLILNQMKLVEGDIVNTTLITDSINALKKLGYFSEVKVEFVPSTSRPDFGTIQVFVKEEERKTLDLGISYGTESGLGGDANFGYNNIQGSGMDFSVQAYKTEELNRLSAVFRQRNILDSQNNLTVNPSYSEYKRDEYQKNVIAARVMLEREIARNVTLGVGTRVEFVGIDNVQAGMPAQVYDATGSTHTVAGLVSTVVYQNEKLDESGEAVGGNKFRMTFMPSYADEEVYLKAAATAIQHLKLAETETGKSHVLTGRITIAYVGENAPFYEKLYGGGETTLRGYRTYGIAPTGSKLGGTNIVSGGTYYSFPLSGDTFRGVAFLEAASVGNGFSDLGDIRAVGGVGLRANLSESFLSTRLEGGLVVPLLKKSGDEVNPFYIMFGNYHPIYDL